MSPPSAHQQDPIGWTAALTLLFAGLCAVRLIIPSTPMFDEVHYLPAARALLELSYLANREHPPLGKELIAIGIWLLGDRPLGWRAMPLTFGALALFAAMRAMWFASASRFASLAFSVLLITGFPLLVQSRIAMLDIFMVALTLTGLWMVAAALRENETGRWRLPLAGLALGFAMAAKWNAAPVAILPGLAFAAERLRHAGWRGVLGSRALPVRGMALPEAFLWLGVLPLLAYAATYLPFAFLAQGAVPPAGLVGLHREMLALQEQALPSHTYQSRWWQWVIDWRAIWYLYEPIDGAQRGVLLVGNPLTMLMGLPAVAWSAWVGVKRGRTDALAIAGLYAASLMLWIFAGKNVQFYYHYFLPSCFLFAALALALDALWQRGWRVLPLAVLAGSTVLFAYFWPILTVAPLANDRAFERWTWLDSWR